MTLNRLAGYAFLIEKYKLNVIPNWHISLISQLAIKNTVVQDGKVETTYPQSYWPGDRTVDHLEFALKYDGINIAILAELFHVIDAGEITAWVASKQTGKYVRKIWFLYEYLVGTSLPLPDLAQGNYIDLLEKELYYTITPGQRIQRQRMVNNLLGNAAFCPMIRRTEKISLMEKFDIRKRCMDIVAVYSPELLRRALSYLYTKETRSSYRIEHITPSASRTEKFISLLSTAEHRDYCEKALLIDVQNSIIDPRFHDTDYRTIQNYIGETISFQKQRVHYVCPKPEHIQDLMAGLITTHRNLKQHDIPAVVHAAIIAYGFVFMHPFEDGNGRIHRFLIHNILSQRKAIPDGLMFPVSASMLKNPRLYASSLEAYSAPLLQLIDYELDEDGLMTVSGDTRILYAYIDMTAQAEALYDFILKTVEEELREELDFLVSYDRVKTAIQDIVDMPDQKINLFIRLCLQNHGHLSAKKREAVFSFLNDDEINRMEQAVIEGYRVS